MNKSLAKFFPVSAKMIDAAIQRSAFVEQQLLVTQQIVGDDPGTEMIKKIQNFVEGKR